MTAAISRVVLRNEYGASFPLRCYADDGEPVFDESLVPDRLARELRAWAARFAGAYHSEHGWPSLAHYEEHLQEGLRLYVEILAVLPPGVAVSLEVWERSISEPY